MRRALPRAATARGRILKRRRHARAGDARPRTCPSRRSRRRESASYRAAAELAKLRGDRPGRVGTPRLPRGGRHPREARTIVEESGDDRDEAVGVELTLGEQDGRTPLDYVAGIRGLMRVGRGGEGDEHDGYAEGERLGDRRGACATDDEIRGGERGAHLLAEEPVDAIPRTQLLGKRVALGLRLPFVGVAGVVDEGRAPQEPRERARDRAVDCG